MGDFVSSLGIPIWLFTLIIVGIVAVAIWDLVWKLFAMWKAAKKKSVVWFVVLMLINSVGILPILYIYVFSEMKTKKGVGRK
jgi:hypothetical protein